MVFFKNILTNAGVDKTIAFTVSTRLFQAVGGIISIAFIAKFLTINEQGYYYTFASIIAIQLFFELGLSSIITQYSAHEFAHLAWDQDTNLIGAELNISRLSSILRFCIKWFGIISLVFFFTLLFVGFYFFLTYSKAENISWRIPWIILSISTSLNLFIDPLLAFLEGVGKIEDIAKVRFVQKLLFTILLFIFFCFGFKLYSSALASITAILITYIQILFSKKYKILKLIWFGQSKWTVNYIKEIFPYQWRLAVGFVCGYFIYQIFNPVLFATEGPKIAGQFGMSIQALTGIISLSMSWITTKVPVFSEYIAKRQFNKLDYLFQITFRNILLLSGLLFIVFNLSVYILKIYNLEMSNRFMQPLPTMILSIAIFSNQFIFSWATYLRCHKSEPLMGLQIVTAILVSISTISIGHYFGLVGIVSGYAVIITFLSVPWAYYLFVNKRKQWHI